MIRLNIISSFMVNLLLIIFRQLKLSPLLHSLRVALILFALLLNLIGTNISQPAFGQDIENWQTYVDPQKRFTLFYPAGWQVKGKENFLSSVDLTLTNPNSTRPFEIAITYRLNDSSLDYTGIEDAMPQKHLLNLEQQLKPAYSTYNIVEMNLSSYSMYGFPTIGHIVDYTKHNGESGRALNVLGVIKGESLFLFSYSNSIEDFYKSLPIINEILKSVVILK